MRDEDRRHPTCWGNNGSGRATVPAGTGAVTAISAGGAHTCAIKTGDAPACWGSNAGSGQTTIPGAVTAISAGGAHTCAIKTDGTPTCWGYNGSGRATIPAGTGTVTAISAGIVHTCAIKTGGTPTCWGHNGEGQTTIPPEFTPADSDGDGVDDATDNCVDVVNSGQRDQDRDRIGDKCDADRDGDGDGVDNTLDAFPGDPAQS